VESRSDSGIDWRKNNETRDKIVDSDRSHSDSLPVRRQWPTPDALPTGAGASSPYNTWQTAASNIQDALTVPANTLVLVSNGTYNVASQIMLTNGVVLRSVTAPPTQSCNVPRVGRASSRSATTWRARRFHNTQRRFVRARGWEWRRGGFGRGTVQNCLVMNNHAVAWAGGINMNKGNCMVSNCVVTANYGAAGGGIGVAWSPGYINVGQIVNCIITSNTVGAADWSASGGGAGVYAYAGGITVRNCLIASNTTRFFWGRNWLLSLSGFVIVQNCTIGFRTTPATRVWGWWGGGVRRQAFLMTNSIVIFQSRRRAAATISMVPFCTLLLVSPDLANLVNGNVTK